MCELDPEPKGDRERELMAAFYNCSSEAFEELCDRCLPRLHAFFRMKGFDREDAEDLSLDVMVRLYSTKERRSFNTNQPLQPFMFTIARHLAIAEWRERSRTVQQVSLQEARDVCEEPSRFSSDLLNDILLCLQEMTETEQSYMALCQRHGLGELSHNEIAAVLEKWPAQITQISKRARLRLKTCLTMKGY